MRTILAALLFATGLAYGQVEVHGRKDQEVVVYNNSIKDVKTVWFVIEATEDVDVPARLYTWHAKQGHFAINETDDVNLPLTTRPIKAGQTVANMIWPQSIPAGESRSLKTRYWVPGKTRIAHIVWVYVDNTTGSDADSWGYKDFQERQRMARSHAAGLV